MIKLIYPETKLPNVRRFAFATAPCTSLLLLFGCCYSSAVLAQSAEPARSVRLKHSVPLPSTHKTSAKTRKAVPQSTINSSTQLVSSVVLQDEDLLIDEEQEASSVDANTDREKVTPLPINPSENSDSDWLKTRVEDLPRKREIYPLESDNPKSLPATPEAESSDDSFLVPDDSNGSVRPMDESADAQGTLEELSPSVAPSPPSLGTTDTRPMSPTHNTDRSYENTYPAPRFRHWPEIENLPNTLAHQLNAVEQFPQVSHTRYVENSLVQDHRFIPRGILQQRVDQQLQCNVPVPAPPTNVGAPPASCYPYTPSHDFHQEDFAPTWVFDLPPNTAQELETYYGKKCVPTPRPPIELFRPFYSDGIFSPAIPVFSDVNPLMPQFLVYGDYRVGVGIHRDALGNNQRSIANRLNIDMDLRLTGTERFHAFMAPFDNNGQSTRLDFNNSRDVRFESEMDAQLETGFFEGDLGAMYGGLTGQDAPFDLPIAIGLMPLVFQNGIWMEDIVSGVAIALPWRHSQALNWSNYEMTFFALFDQITTPAFANNNGVGSAFGTAWFIEAYEGYIEADYAYMLNRVEDDFSYHNVALAYTRRYFQFLSNSVRVINNVGQNFDPADRTADGTLLLVENAFRTSKATTVIPYANFFYGLRRTQSAARAGVAGGILRNTGIMFESDNLTNYPTLDATGNGTYGGAFGLNLFASDFRQQFVFEFAALDSHGDDVFNNINGAEYGFGGRYQRALNNWSLLRLDAMVGMRDDAPDLYGSRAEWRRKF